MVSDFTFLSTPAFYISDCLTCPGSGREIPADYSQGADGKYYKLSARPEQYIWGLRECQQDGANFPTFKTLQEFDAMYDAMGSKLVGTELGQQEVLREIFKLFF